MANSASLTDKNLYAYCDNNPVIRIDESGKFWNIATGAIIGGLISGASQALDNIATGKWNSRNASGKITYLAQNYKKVLNREVGITTAKYTFGTAGANFAKKSGNQYNEEKSNCGGIY